MNATPTLPLAAVELDPHAHGLGVGAVGDEAYPPHDDRGVQLAQLRVVRVRVALDDLHEVVNDWFIDHNAQHFIHNRIIYKGNVYVTDAVWFHSLQC